MISLVKFLVEKINKSGHTIQDRKIVKDMLKSIRNVLETWCIKNFIDVIITTGGTGLTGRDVTPEAVK